jgi:hypothetical protein
MVIDRRTDDRSGKVKAGEEERLSRKSERCEWYGAQSRRSEAKSERDPRLADLRGKEK